MNCPVCGEKMKEVEKSGVLLDICPGCKGVWLDRGELEKLLEVAAATPDAASAQRTVPHTPDPSPRRDYRDAHGHHDHDDDDDRYERHHDEHHDRDDHYRGHEGQQGRYPRKRSWLSSILESFGDD